MPEESAGRGWLWVSREAVLVSREAVLVSREAVLVSREAVLALHDEALADHGGMAGVRDEGMLESALMRPVRKADYGDPDAAELAAAYAFGIVHNHPFVDGNKRAGLLTSELSLAVNGFDLGASNAECVVTFLALAAGEIEEEELAAWFRGHIEAES